MTKLFLPNQVVELNSPIIANGNFSWSEATKGGTRVPEDQVTVGRIIRIATALEEVRKFLGGHPMKVHSWYRPPSVNRAVGGAADSRHLYGDAVDFSLTSIAPFTVYEKLDGWWGGRGGLGKGRSFTHIDLRGYKSRWNYGS